MLRGVENKQIARNIFFVYFTNIFHYPDYSVTKNKEEGGKEKKKIERNQLASQLPSPIHPSWLALTSQIKLS